MPVTVVAVEELPDGSTIRIEVDDTSGQDLEEIYAGVETRDVTGKVLETGRSLFQEALDLVDSCAAAVSAQLTRMTPHRPDEVELQLAIKVDGKVGARVVELSSGAQVQVLLRWKQPPHGG